MSAERLPPAVADAVQWLALQRSGAMSEHDRHQLRQWLQASQDNRLAWERLQHHLGQAFDELPANTLQVLSRAGNGRRHLLRGALGLAGLGLGGWWLQRQGLWPLAGTDLSSGFAERRAFELEDGSRVLLNAQSRVELGFDAHQRLLILREGALGIRVAADPRRALVVRTAFGEARALGTRFSVALNPHEARVWVQESRVRLNTPNGQHLLLDAGQGASLDASGIHPLDPRQVGEGTWEDGLLEVRDQPLGAVAEALRPYRRGLLRVDPAAAALRVSGVFPLDDSEQALRSLQEVLPIKVEHRFGWWTQVSLR